MADDSVRADSLCSLESERPALSDVILHSKSGNDMKVRTSSSQDPNSSAKCINYKQAKEESVCLLSPYRCYKCNLDFNGGMPRLKHMKTTHLTSEGYECGDCSLIFPTHKDFNDHHYIVKVCDSNLSNKNVRISTHPKTKSASVYDPFRCPKCKLEYRTVTMLRRHFAHHLKTNPFVCKLSGCDSVFGDYYFLKRHVFKKHCKPGIELKCEIPTGPGCDGPFSTFYYFRSHLTRFHPGVPLPDVLQRAKEDNEQLHVTSKLPAECKLVVQFNEALKHDPVVLKLLKKDPSHADIINRLTVPTAAVASKRLFLCKICPYSTKMFNYFKNHMKTFHGMEVKDDVQVNLSSSLEMSKLKNGSTKLLSNQVILSNSKSSKSPESSFIAAKRLYCLYDKCWQSFKSISERKRHEKKMHGSFKCTKCDFITPSNVYLKRHYKVAHENPDEILKCPYCGKFFCRPQSLEAHILKHYGENPDRSSCHICGQVYTNVFLVRNHIATAHAEESTSSDSD